MQALDQGVGAAQIVVLLVAVAIVAFRRVVIRWLIVLVSIAIIATMGFGLITVWQATHHMTV